MSHDRLWAGLLHGPSSREGAEFSRAGAAELLSVSAHSQQCHLGLRFPEQRFCAQSQAEVLAQPFCTRNSDLKC